MGLLGHVKPSFKKKLCGYTLARASEEKKIQQKKNLYEDVWINALARARDALLLPLLSSLPLHPLLLRLPLCLLLLLRFLRLQQQGLQYFRPLV